MSRRASRYEALPASSTERLRSVDRCDRMAIRALNRKGRRHLGLTECDNRIGPRLFADIRAPCIGSSSTVTSVNICLRSFVRLRRGVVRLRRGVKVGWSGIVDVGRRVVST